MSKILLPVLFVAVGVLQLTRALRGFRKRAEFTALGEDSISQELTRPRISRYMVVMSLMMIFIGLFGLVLVAAEYYRGH
jgi:hypothetical protein